MLGKLELLELLEVTKQDSIDEKVIFGFDKLLFIEVCRVGVVGDWCFISFFDLKRRLGIKNILPLLRQFLTYSIRIENHKYKHRANKISIIGVKPYSLYY